jgi:shikimate dehydrogenase
VRFSDPPLEPVRQVDLPVQRRSSRSSPTWPSAVSTVVGVIGDPVAHSLSPLLHNAAFDAMGLDWVSVAFRVPQGHVAGALDGMRALELAGLSVTTPHKQAAASCADELSPLAERLEATNCLVRKGSRLIGHSTDGVGFVESLRRGAAFDPRGARCVVLGAGGAARAVILALAEAGASELIVVNRTSHRAEVAAALAGDAGRVGSPEDISQADLVVQATSLGMGAPIHGVTSAETGDLPDSLPVDAALLRGDQLVADLVYEPAVTPFLEAARARGARTVGGLGMLVHQAARAIELWTGRSAPVEEMWQAANWWRAAGGRSAAGRKSS